MKLTKRAPAPDIVDLISLTRRGGTTARCEALEVTVCACLGVMAPTGQWHALLDFVLATVVADERKKAVEADIGSLQHGRIIDQTGVRRPDKTPFLVAAAGTLIGIRSKADLDVVLAALGVDAERYKRLMDKARTPKRQRQLEAGFWLGIQDRSDRDYSYGRVRDNELEILQALLGAIKSYCEDVKNRSKLREAFGLEDAQTQKGASDPIQPDSSEPDVGEERQPAPSDGDMVDDGDAPPSRFGKWRRPLLVVPIAIVVFALVGLLIVWWSNYKIPTGLAGSVEPTRSSGPTRPADSTGLKLPAEPTDLEVNMQRVESNAGRWSVAFDASQEREADEFLKRADQNEPWRQKINSETSKLEIDQYLEDALDAGAYFVGGATIVLELRNTSTEEMKLLDIRPLISERQPPVNGAAIFLPSQGAGPVPLNYLGFALDEAGPEGKEILPGGALGRVYFRDVERFVIPSGGTLDFRLDLRAQAAAFTLMLDVDYSIGGRPGSLQFGRTGKSDGPPWKISASLCSLHKSDVPADQLAILAAARYGQVRETEYDTALSGYKVVRVPPERYAAECTR